MDWRYIKIKMMHLKQNQEACEQWVEDEDVDRLDEYLDDIIKNVNEIKSKL